MKLFDKYSVEFYYKNDKNQTKHKETIVILHGSSIVQYYTKTYIARQYVSSKFLCTVTIEN